MAHQPPISPDTRKKKPALPSLLSNLRNAHSAIASSVTTTTTESRPLVNANASSNDHSGNYASDRSNLKRYNVSTRPALEPTPNNRPNNPQNNTSSLSSTLLAIQHRFETSWRKRSQHLHKEDDSLRHNSRRRRQIRVSIPQSFLLSSICFFIIMPIIVLLYVLARKSVFGDEGVEMSEHKYEVKRIEGENMTVEGQTSVLAELEGQFEDVIGENKNAMPAENGASLTEEESVQVDQDQMKLSQEEEIGHFETNDFVDAKQFAEDTIQNEADSSGLQQFSDTDPKEGNLRGYKSSTNLEAREESSNADVEIDESNPKIDSLGNVELNSEQSLSIFHEKSALESPAVELLQKEEDSA